MEEPKRSTNNPKELYLVLKELSGLTKDQNNAENMEYDETSRNDGLHLKDLYSSLIIGELHIRKMGKTEQEIKIGVLFNGKMKVCSVSKFTTCDDVIEMLMYSSASVDRAHEYMYALFETAHGVEKMLTGKSSVLKVVRSWGAAKGDVSLLVRKVDGVIKKKIKISKAKRKLEKIRSMLMAHKSENKHVNDTINKNLNEDQRDEKNVYEKIVKIQNEESLVSQQSGKIALMKRYLHDAEALSRDSYETKVANTFSDMGVDTFEHGFESSLDLDTAFVDELDDTVTDTKDELNDCVIFDEADSDTESAFCESEFSEDELERNVFEDDLINMKTIRELFDQVRYKHNASYDRAMESFMESVVCREHGDTDEGLSSMGSDL